MSNETEQRKDDHAERLEALKLGGAESGTRRARRSLMIIGLGVGAAAVGASAYYYFYGRSEPYRYITQAAMRGNLVVKVSATGTLDPTNQVEIGSEISGTVKTVEVDHNDTVRKGQVLATLDTSKLQAQVHQSQAALESARAKVLQAQASRSEAELQVKRLTQVRELTEGAVPSQSDFDAAKAALERANAEVASAKALVSQGLATLEAQRTDLAKAVIRSPIDGIVLTRSVEPGQTVAATLQSPILFVLAENLAQMELHVDVDEADVSQVHAGQAATFTVDAYPDREFTAHVTRVHFGAQTVGGVVTYEAALAVDNSSLALRPGMTATAEIIVQKLTDALLVPNSALRFEPPAENAEPKSSGDLVSRLLPHPPARRPAARALPERASRQRRVWTLSDGKPVSLAVETGATDGIMTQITSGEVRPGTPLIVEAAAARS